MSPTSDMQGLSLETVAYEKKGRIAYVTMNRPKVLNALNRTGLADLKAAFEDARDDESIRGVILTGAGDKSFIAGADINEVATDTPVQAEEKTRRGHDLMDLIENLGKPVIAAVNGFALGGGCEAALACTIRLASDSAKFGLPEVKLGIIPGYGGTQRLPRLVGKGVRDATDSHRGHDRRRRSSSRWVGERSAPGRGADRPRRSDFEPDRRQCASVDQVRDRSH